MKTIKILSIIVLLALFVSLYGCKKKIVGCMDTTAYNYNPEANDGNDVKQCTYAVVAFWSKKQNLYHLEVYMDGWRKILDYNPQAGYKPSDCYDKYAESFNLKYGQYFYYAMNFAGDTLQTGYVTAINNECQIIEIL